MNATEIRLNQTSIVQYVMLGRAGSTLCIAMEALALQSILFAKIEPLVVAGDNVADLARVGSRAAGDALADCRDHVSSGDVIGVVDCLTRAVSGHRAAKNLLAAIAEVGDAEVGILAQLGINLAMSVMSDLGCE
ncbi:hypothetical protein [Paraburkholderia sediminicola]|uniref:hypothetical protein n=1 Tax=Paraburkholderia sediminicola TaxID=458836 RepID=UPI0038B92B1E